MQEAIANDDSALLLVQLHTRLVDFLHRRASWQQARIE
jgi:hypothetical protein